MKCAAYHKVREETKDWGDCEKLPEEIPEFPLIRRMLLGAVSVVQTPSLRAFETNERRIGKFVETMDPYFVGGITPSAHENERQSRIT